MGKTICSSALLENWGDNNFSGKNVYDALLENHGTPVL
jgi:hypothetical protein